MVSNGFKKISAVLVLALSVSVFASVSASAATEKRIEIVEATPTASKIMVNNQEVSFEAYNINGSNYFKLRDLAKAVNGSEKQFAVGWDASKNSISLESGKTYTAVGAELIVSGKSETKKASQNNSKIYLDGNELQLTAHNVDGNNYFKLRDIAKAFNIGVTWDGKANTIGVETNSEYVEEQLQLTDSSESSKKLTFDEIYSRTQTIANKAGYKLEDTQKYLLISKDKRYQSIAFIVTQKHVNPKSDKNIALIMTNPNHEEGLDFAVNWLNTMGMNLDSNFKVWVKQYIQEVKNRAMKTEVGSMPDLSGIEDTITQGIYSVSLSTNRFGVPSFYFYYSE